MQVNSQIFHQKTVAPEAQLELKQGEVYSASIKEKVNNSEAILQIRGKDVAVKFADGVPADQGRITVQVKGQSDGHVNVKTIATESSKTISSENKVLASLGLSEKDSTMVKQAVKTLLEKGAPLTKEIVADLKNFMIDGKDTVESKLETVRSLANKRLEATQPQLRAVHEALHGKPLNEVLTNLAKEMDPTFKLEKAPNLQKESTNTSKLNAPTVQKEVPQKATGQQEPAKITLQKSVATNDIVNNKMESTASAMSKENATVKNTSELSELIRNSRQLVEKEPDLKKAIQHIKEEIIKNPKLDRELANSINKATQEAEKLQTIGKERLVQALKNAEGMLLKQEQQSIKSAPAESQSITVKDSQPMKLSEVVKNINVEVSKNPNLNQTIGKVREQIVENQSLPKELSQKVKLALTAASSLEKQGRITVGKAVLSQTLTEVQNALEGIEGKGNQLDQNSKQTASETVKNVKVEIQQEPNLQKAVEKVRDQVVNNPKVDREVAQKIEQALKETISLQKVGQESVGRDRLQQALTKAEVELKQIESRQPAQQTQVVTSTEPRSSEVVKNVKAEIQSEPNLQKAVEKVRDQVVNNPKVDREFAQKVEQAVKETLSLQKIGQEPAGRDRLQQVLVKAEVELKQIESRQPAQQTQVANSTEPRSSEIVKNVKAEIQSEPNLQKAVEKVRDQVVNNPKIDQEVTQKVEQAIKETISLQKVGQESVGRERLQQALTKAEVELKQIESRQPAQQTQVTTSTDPSSSEIVKNVKAEIQSEPNLQKAVEKVRDQIVNNPKMDREVAQKVEQALKETNPLQKVGQELAGRDRLQQALTKAEVELKQIESRQPAQQTQVTTSTEPRSSEIVKNVKAEIQLEPNLQKAVEKVRDQIVNNQKIDREVTQKVDQVLKETISLQKVGQELVGRERLQQASTKAEVELKQIESRQPAQQTQVASSTDPRPSEIVKNVKAEIQQEPDLQKAVEKVKDQVVNNPKINQEVAQKVDQALKESLILKKVGQESAGLNRIQQALTKAEIELKQIEPPQQTQMAKPSQETAIRESIKQVREEIQSTTDTKKIIQKVQDLVANVKNSHPESTRNIERFANQASQLDQAGRERLTHILRQVESALNQTEVQGQETKLNINTKPQSDVNGVQQQNSVQKKNPVQLQETAEQPKVPEIRPSESIKQALKIMNSEPNMELALDKIQKEIAGNPAIDVKTIDKAEKVINHAQQLQDKGREMTARQQLTKELTDIQQELAKTESRISPEKQPIQNATQYDVNEMLQSLSIQSKDILITKVSQKLAQATHDFRDLKREITRNLDNVERVINSFKKNAYPHAKQMLETTISKLDNAILKSEMMLFTDMKTEKQLMQASGQLAEAKKLLAKGDHAEASKIVHEVKSLVDKMIFKPSEQKIMHYVNKESMMMDQKSTSQQILSQFSEAAHGANKQELTARQMYDTVRSLGLNHESEVANSLVFHKNDSSGQQEQQQQNLKAALMKLVQGEGQEVRTSISQQAEQALNNLTGQQLLSKSDGNGSLQSMFFNLPLMLGEKLENLQVFINSKNEGEQVEWENCNLYFLLETKKLGDIGILLNSTDRNLSITIKNDLPGFKEKMEPLANMTKERLQEVGYNVSSINFSRMNSVKNQAVSHDDHDKGKSARPVFTEKGMDFTI